jgi:crossover junction endodeoxyribonuclease RuvC
MLLLGLKEKPRPDDAADALAIAICHAHTRKFEWRFKQ